MTELNEIHYRIDPVAFVAALVGGPILFTAATFWVLYIPVIALMLGGIPYLLVGTPVLLIHLRHHRPDTGDIAWLAFLAFAVAWAAFMGALLMVNPSDWHGVLGAGLITLFFGTIFSAGWGASFGWLYAALVRDQPAAPFNIA